MDWGRAKTILVLSFLSLNIILGYQLWENRGDRWDSFTGQSGITKETDQLIQSRNIQIVQEIPRDIPNLPSFTVRLDEAYQFDHLIALPDPFAWNSVPQRSPNMEQYLKQYINKAELYQLDPVASRDGIYSLNQMIDIYPIFDIKLELHENQGMITAYRQAYVEILPVEEQKDHAEQRVISAHTAVRSIVENYLPDGTTIVDIRLGYHGQVYNSPTHFLLPSWRIATASGDLYYFNAHNGTVVIPKEEKNNSTS